MDIGIEYTIRGGTCQLFTNLLFTGKFTLLTHLQTLYIYLYTTHCLPMLTTHVLFETYEVLTDCVFIGYNGSLIRNSTQ